MSAQSAGATKQAARGAIGNHRGPLGAHRGTAAAPNTKQPVRRVEPIPIIHFGKIDYRTPAHFEAESAKHLELLQLEKHMLLEEVAAYADACEDFRDPPWHAAEANAETGVFKTFTTFTLDEARRAWTREVRPLMHVTSEMFSDLRRDIKKVAIPTGAFNEHDVYDLGVNLRDLRPRVNELRAQIQRERVAIIAAAGHSAELVGLVEETAVQTLIIVGDIAQLNPAAELAYKLGVAVMHGAARGLGASLAGTDAQAEFAATLRGDLPGIVSGWLRNRFGAFLRNRKNPFSKHADAILTSLAETIVNTCIDLGTLWISKGGRATKEDVYNILEGAFYNAIAGILSSLFATEDKSFLKRAAAAVLSAAVQTVSSEIVDIKRRVKEERSDYFEVVLARLPFLIARFAQQVWFEIVASRKFAPLPSAPSTPGPRRPSFVRNIRQQLHAIGRSFQKSTHVPAGPKLTPEQRARHVSETNLHERPLEGILEYCRHHNVIAVIRRVNAAFRRLYGKPGVWPKPQPVKLKTERGGHLDGRSAVPIDEAGRAEHWKNEDQNKAREAGLLIRSDRLIFHPDMLLELHHASAGPGDVAGLVDLLKRASAADFLDLRERAAQDWLQDQKKSMPEGQRLAIEEAEGFFETALIGYRSDIDVCEIIDATTGRRITLDAKEDRRSLGAMRENLERLNLMISKDAPRLPDGSIDPRHRETQHGGAVAIRYDDGHFEFPIGDVNVFLPDGQMISVDAPVLPAHVHEIDLRSDEGKRLRAIFKQRSDRRVLEKVELEIRKYTGEAHLTLPERHDIAQSQEAATRPTSPKGRLRSKTAGELPRSDIEPTITLSGRYRPIRPHDIQGSLVARSLVVIHPANREWLAPLLAASWVSALAASLAALKVTVGVGPERGDVVLATADYDGIADALVRLGRADAELRTAGLTARRWWELYSPHILATWGGIAGALPDHPDGLDVTPRPGTEHLSSTRGPRGTTLRQFRACRGGPAFSPDGDVVRGVYLENVWRSETSDHPQFTDVAFDGRKVLMLRVPPTRVDGDVLGDEAVVAPVWVVQFDLSTEEGLRRALVNLHALRDSDPSTPATLADGIKMFQSSVYELKVDGRMGPRTRGAMRRALARFNGDGVIAAGH